MTQLLRHALPQWETTTKHRTMTRVHLAASADLLRMEGRFVRAEALFRQATRYADGGAFDHLVRQADHCRQMYKRQQKAKKAKAARKARKGGAR